MGTTAAPLIFAAMLAVKAQANKDGIAKDRTSSAEGKYKYRGVDDALDYFAGTLATYKIGWLPAYSDVVRETKKTKNGEGLITTLKGTFTFFAEDGSQVVCGPFCGEAFDSMDKSMSKAMSVALRNCLLQTFVVPLGPGHDPEESEEDEPSDPPPPVEAKDRGIHLSENRESWLRAKMAQYDCDEATLFKSWPRVDDNNIEQVAAWLKS